MLRLLASLLLLGLFVQPCLAFVLGQGQGHSIQDEGLALNPRPALNFTGPGVTCADNAVTAATECIITSGGGGGDVSSNTASSVDNEMVLFFSTTGKILKRATTTGILKGTAGVLSAAVSETDYVTPTGAGAFANKTLDLANNTLITSLLQLNNAISDGDVPPTTRTITVTGTDELTCTGGTQDLAANRTWSCSLAATVDLNGQAVLMTRGTTPPLTCTVGQLFFDTNEIVGQNFYGCTATNVWTLLGDGGSAIADGPKGDITVSGTGTVWTINNNVVTYAKLQDVANSQRLLGRFTVGSGDVEEGDATAVKTMLSLQNVDNTSDVAKNSATGTLTSKTIDLASNTLITSLAQLNNAISDANVPPEARTLLVQGTTDEITCTGGVQDLSANRTWTCAFAPIADFNGQAVLMTRGTTPPPTCTVGQLFFDTDESDGENFYGCTATNTWTLLGDGTGAAGTVTVSGTPNTGEIAQWASGTSITGVPVSGTGPVLKGTNPTITLPLSLTIFDNAFTIQDNADPTKQAQIMAGAITTGTTHTYTLFNASDTFACLTCNQNLLNKTLTTPTIASFANAQHTHVNAAGGGQLTDAALFSAVSVPKGGTGATSLTGLLQGNVTAAVTGITSSTVGQVLRVTGANAFAFGAVDLADTDAVTGVLPAVNLPNAAADATTKGVASFAANDFLATSGNITLNYAAGQAASASTKGFLTAADWNTFNAKQPALGFTPAPASRLLNTTTPLAGGGDLAADRTLSIADAAADGTTKGAASFTANDFLATAGNISLNYSAAQAASTSTKGFLTAADWTTFNAKLTDPGSNGLVNRTGAGTTTAVTSVTVGQVLRVTGANTFVFGAVDLALPAAVTGVLPDANIPHLNTLSTGLTISRCVETDGTGLLTVAAGPCGTPGGSGTVTQIDTTAPLAGGPITTTGTLSIANAAADGSTKGAASFTANDFLATAGNISLNYSAAQAASTSTKGFLTAADWNTFNAKAPSSRLIQTTAPLAGGGDLSADRTLTIANAVADGSTKGAATFVATDFLATAGVVSLNYSAAQAASTSTKGFLTAADWNLFNAKVPAARLIQTTAPLAGGGDLSADRTLTIANALADGATKGAASFTAADFTATAGNISINYASAQAASTSTKGFLTAADWNTFNNKQPALGFTAVPEARTLTVQGTTDELTCTGGAQTLAGDRTWTCAFAAITDFNGQRLLMTRGTAPPPTCTVGELFFDTNESVGQNFYGCTTTNSWTLLGDGTGAAGTVTVTGTPNTGEIAQWSSGTSITGVAVIGTGSVVKNTNATINTPILTVLDTQFTIQDQTDTAKQARFEATGITSGQTRTYTLFDANDTFACLTCNQNLLNKTLTTPTIASFANAAHDHITAAGGGQLTDAALSAAVTVPKGGTGATTLTGLVVGNGTGTMTAVTSSTVGQIPRVTGANTYAFGALDLALPAAVTGVLPAANHPNAVADGATKGIAAFTTNDFLATAGVISLNYSAAQAASASTKGFLTAADWTTFNAKGSGTVTTTGTPTSGQAAEFTAATVIQGVTYTGTGSPVKGTSPVLTTPFLAGVNPQTGTTYTVVAADNQRLVTFSNAAAVAVTLPQATTVGFTNGAVFHFRNLGAGVVTITPTTSTIDGTASILLRTDQSADVFSNGTNYLTQRMFNSPLTTAGDLMYGGVSGMPTRLAGAAGLLRSNGTTPSWAELSGDVSTSGSNVTTLATVPVAKGGTGATTLAGLLQGNGTSAVTVVTNSVTVGQVLRVTGANAYAWGALDLADTDAVTGLLPDANLTTNIARLGTSNAWADGIKQTFNPNATNAGLNVGSHTATPSFLADGDLWYNSTNNTLNAQINGVAVALGAAGGISGAVANGAMYATGATTATSTTALNDGEILIGRTGLTPQKGSLTGSSTVTVTPGAASITLSVPTNAPLNLGSATNLATAALPAAVRYAVTIAMMNGGG